MTGKEMASPVVLPGMKYRFSVLDDAVVRFDVHSSSQKISARWSDGELHVITPPGFPMKRAAEFLRERSEEILRRRPTLRFHIGQELRFGDILATIGTQNLKPRHVFMQGEYNKPMILVGTECDIDGDEVTAIISRMLCQVARTTAPTILIPRAKALAESLGVHPAGWKISSGHRTLGRCSSTGEIALSSVLVLMPADLRDYIICHELAHLTYMDHSREFHELCDRYCGGRERELIKKLKKYQWPILRK